MKQILRVFVLMIMALSTFVVVSCTKEKEPEKFTVSVVEGTGGGVFEEGTSVTITANTKGNDYEFDGWYEGTEKVGNETTYTFTVSKDVTYEAKFNYDPYRNLSEDEKDDYINDVTAKWVNRYVEGQGNYFDGWNTTYEVQDDVVSPVDSEAAAKITIEAAKDAEGVEKITNLLQYNGVWSTCDIGLFGKTVDVTALSYLEFDYKFVNAQDWISIRFVDKDGNLSKECGVDWKGDKLVYVSADGWCHAKYNLANLYNYEKILDLEQTLTTEEQTNYDVLTKAVAIRIAVSNCNSNQMEDSVIYIDNLHLTNTPFDASALDTEIRGQMKRLDAYVQSKSGDTPQDMTINLDKKYDVTDIGTIEFDILVEGTGKVSIMFGNWTKHSGYKSYYADNIAYDPAGYTWQTLDDGWLHVTIDPATAMPADFEGQVEFIYVRGNWCDDDTTCKIDEVTVNPPALRADVKENSEKEGGGYTDITVDFAGDGYEVADVDTIQFDVKVAGTDKVSIMIGNWDSHYGYKNYYADRVDGNPAGYSYEVLEDGYLRVTIDVYAAKPADFTGKIDLVYVRGAWCNTTCKLSHVVVNELVVPASRANAEATTESGGSYSEITHSFDMKYLPEDVKTIKYDIKVEDPDGNDRKVRVMIGNWDKNIGYLKTYSTYIDGTNAGVSTRMLSDGWMRVTIDVAKALPADFAGSLEFIYIASKWTTTTCQLDNVQVELKPFADRSNAKDTTAGADFNIYFKDELAAADVTTISFDYKLTSDGKMTIAVMNNAWSTYMGYFDFNENTKYDGVKQVKHADGWYTVTITIAEVTKIENAVGNARYTGGMKLIYVRGAWSTANAKIDNVRVNGVAADVAY